MSRAELEAIQKSGVLSRGGLSGTTSRKRRRKLKCKSCASTTVVASNSRSPGHVGSSSRRILARYTSPWEIQYARRRNGAHGSRRPGHTREGHRRSRLLIRVEEMTVELTGRTVLIRLSDPWELGESLRWAPLAAVILAAKTDEQGGALFVRIKEPFLYKNLRCEYFVMQPRHESSSVEDLRPDRPVLCAITRVPEERSSDEDPFDLSWWRGGIAGIGEISIAEQPQ